MKTFVRNFFTVVLIAVMTLVADLTGDREIIFPEIGALCIGLWIVDKHVWLVKRWQIPVLFLISSVIGVLIVKFITLHLVFQLLIGYILISLVLMFSRTSITPAVSACMLPVLMQVDTWVYPITVLILTTLLVAGQKLLEKIEFRNPAEKDFTFSVGKSYKDKIIRMLELSLMMLPLIFVAVFFDCKLLVVPPLIVTLIEFSNSASGFRLRPKSTWLLIVACATIGALGEIVLHQYFNLPQVIPSAVVSASVLTIFYITKRYFAPAMALSLVPMIIPDNQVLMFPLFVALGAVYFILMPKLFFRKNNCAN